MVWLTFTLCIHCMWFRNWSKSLINPSQISQMTNLPDGFTWPGFEFPVTCCLVNICCCIAFAAFSAFCDCILVDACLPKITNRKKRLSSVLLLHTRIQLYYFGTAVIDILGCWGFFWFFEAIGCNWTKIKFSISLQSICKLNWISGLDF